MDWFGRLWTWVMIWASMGVRGLLAACTMAEFPCRNQKCISLDKYCDGTRDCEDGSDEPSGCSPCNRTYYGRVGSTYTLQVPKPGKGGLPHFCQLTFIASGDVYGDLVQISVEKFNLGRFNSHLENGCPDGYMQIEELSRPPNSGYWCGTAWGHNLYYSETSAVTVMLRVFNLTESSNSNPAATNQQDTVLLKISYKFLIKEKAVLRYGAPYSPNYRGEDVSGTFCDKYFENCDKKNCKIQSPNFPGMYPRNLSCHFHIKQTRVPDGKVALVRVRQRNPHLIYVKDKNAPHLSKEKRFWLGDACHILHDYLIIFDGNTTHSPVLLKACKGASLSPITASGPDMLILFHASPFDFPFQDSPRRHVFGFQLDVEIVLVDRESTAYIRHSASPISALYPALPSTTPYSCQWEISSRGQRSGYVQAPVHSLLANTTCIWKLLASPSEVVWLYFLHYRHVMHLEMPAPSQCPNTLTIYDGGPPELNGTLLGQFCRPDSFPRVCSGVHAPGAAGANAPCPPSESYVSITPSLTLSLRYAAGSTPATVEFLARYEFVDLRQWGYPTAKGGSCDRTFGPRPMQLFASPRNVFLFGRGGTRRLQCVYTFRVASHQRLRIGILRSRMGSQCHTIYKQSSYRYECSHGGTWDQPAIRVDEEPWEDVRLPRACICNITDDQPYTVMSYTSEVRITFYIPDMSPTEDYNDFYFEGKYEVSDALDVVSCRKDVNQYPERYGNFTIGLDSEKNPCLSFPHLVTAPDGAYLFLRVNGYHATESNCGSNTNRINVFSVGGVTLLSSICPSSDDNYAQVFSNGWFKKGRSGFSLSTKHAFEKNQSYNYKILKGLRYCQQGPGQSRDLVVEFVGNHSSVSLITWVGVWKPLHTAPLSSSGADMCPHMCPEIKACLPAELWCDGTYHCPSGIDEGAAACGLLAALPWVSLGVAVVLLISLMILLAAVMQHRKTTAAKKEDPPAVVQNNGHRMKSATQDLLLSPEKETFW